MQRERFAHIRVSKKNSVEVTYGYHRVQQLWTNKSDISVYSSIVLLPGYTSMGYDRSLPTTDPKNVTRLLHKSDDSRGSFHEVPHRFVPV